jgi:hypothetical protein
MFPMMAFVGRWGQCWGRAVWSFEVRMLLDERLHRWALTAGGEQEAQSCEMKWTVSVSTKGGSYLTRTQ